MFPPVAAESGVNEPSRRREESESVWDDPRMPIVEPTGKEVQVVAGGQIVAWTVAVWRLLERGRPPVNFFLPEASKRCLLVASHVTMQGEGNLPVLSSARGCLTAGLLRLELRSANA